ncbi:MAG: hypothetical protein ACODTL_03630 [Brucella sp.]
MRAKTVNDCYVAPELSQRTWLIGYLLPSSDKVQTVTVAGGNAEALLSARENRNPGRSSVAGRMRRGVDAGLL